MALNCFFFGPRSVLDGTPIIPYRLFLQTGGEGEKRPSDRVTLIRYYSTTSTQFPGSQRKDDDLEPFLSYLEILPLYPVMPHGDLLAVLPDVVPEGGAAGEALLQRLQAALVGDHATRDAL